MTLSIVFTFVIIVLSASSNLVLGHRRHPHTTTTPRPRFPHLDRILNRLDEERYRSTPSPVEWFNPHGNDQTWHQLQQTAWQYPELQSILADSTYGMLRDDWMLDEEDDSDEDDTRDFGKVRKHQIHFQLTFDINVMENTLTHSVEWRMTQIIIIKNLKIKK
jgi:hypothetical protein